MRGLYSDVAAEHTFCILLGLVRNLPLYARQQASSLWEPAGGEASRTDWSTGPGVMSDIDRAHGQLSGHTMEIVGLGEIGRALAKRANAFEMRVVAVDPKVALAPPEIAACWLPDDLHRLLAESDYVVICAPHTPRTARMFGPAEFAKMKPTSYLVNIGRGAIVDTQALTEALQVGRLAGAGLDVVDPEPLPVDHPLWRMPNVLITPHVAGFSPRIAERHLAMLLDNLRRFATGQPLRNLVSKRDWN